MVNAKLKKIISDISPELLPLLEAKENRELLKKHATETAKEKKKLVIQLNGAEATTIKGEKGDRGEVGNDGYTPVKFKDYFTSDEITYIATQILKDATPIKGIHYFDGEKGKDGKDGKNGRDGVNGKDGNSVNHDEIIKKVLDLIPKEKIDVDEILKPLNRRIDELSNTLSPKGKIDQRWHGAGLSRVSTDSSLTGQGTPSSPLSVVASGVGTVTNVSSADANATVATQTTTPVITVVSAPKLQTARTIAGKSFDGTANITIASTDLSDTTSITLLTSTQTLINKRITKRVVVTTQSATPTINTDNTDVAAITALAQAITSFTTNLSGTPVAGDSLIIEITDNGTARAIAWGNSFEASTVALPTTTVISTLLTVGFRWNTTTTKWRCVAVC